MISIKCGLNTFLKWKGNPKIWVVGLFLIFYVYNLTAPIVKFCKEVNYAVSPWLFPYFFSNPTTLLLFMLAFVLYLCDAPFLDQQQVFVLLRTGRQKRTVGQLLYVAAASFAFFLAIFFLSLIFTWPHLQFMNDWGKIIGTLTQTNAGQSYGIMTLSFNLMNNYAPITAMLLSFTLMCGIGILLGNFMFFVNLWGNRSLGVGGATALVLLPALLHFEGFYKFSYLSPVSWGNLSLMASGLATRLTPPYAYKALLLCNMVLIAAIFTTIHKSDLTVEEVVR